MAPFEPFVPEVESEVAWSALVRVCGLPPPEEEEEEVLEWRDTGR